jgi:hypothetical protein
VFNKINNEINNYIPPTPLNEGGLAHISPSYFNERILKNIPPTPLNEGGLNDNYKLLRGVDYNKDQSYFLSGLNQHQLSKALFPIGDMTKKEVRKLAKKI